MKTGLISTTHHPLSISLGSLFNNGLPVTSPECDYHSKINLPRNALGNTQYEDCFPAGIMTLVQLQVSNSMGSTWVPDEQKTLGLYSSVSGFNLSTHQPDPGTMLDVGEAFIWKTGINIGQQAPVVFNPVQLDPKNERELDIGTEYFGGVGLCFDMPIFIMEENPPVWDCPETLDPNNTRTTPGGAGGHFVASGKYNTLTKNRRYCVSWGNEIPITQNFIKNYLSAAVCFASRTTWFNTVGNTVDGINWDQLYILSKKI